MTVVDGKVERRTWVDLGNDEIPTLLYEIAKLREYLGTVAHIIIELSRQGGFENAASF